MTTKLFESQEFAMLRKIKHRLSFLNTENNRNKYNEYFLKCVEIAKKDNNFGWNPSIKRYMWDTISTSDIGKEMIAYDKEVSPIGDFTLYIADDSSSLVLTSKDKTIILKGHEVDAVRNVSAKQFKKIIELKLIFEGSVINGKIERSKPIKENSDLFKFPRK